MQDDTGGEKRVFYKYEIECLINRALQVRDPLTMKRWRWHLWSKRVAASDKALYKFHEVAAMALRRFDEKR